MKKYYFIGAAVLLVGLFINYKYGGFNKTEAVLVSVSDYTIFGAPFEGSYKSNALTNLVIKMRAYQKDLEGESNVVIINYINEAKETLGVVSNFVGVSTLSSNILSLNSLEKRVIKAQKSIRIEVKITPLVMPSPEKIKAKAFEMAKTLGVELQGLSLEQYSSRGVLVVDFPIKNED